jgi:nucleoside phosphorylase
MLRSRFNDIATRTDWARRIDLPQIDWSKVSGQTGPTPLDVAYGGAEAPLPRADVVILTWTSAEWQALDHVFLACATSNAPAPGDLESQWHLYSRNAPASSHEDKLWGYYRLVKVAGKARSFTVMLFKAGAHLAHWPWLSGLVSMVNAILSEAQPSRIYSIGTAGGANDSENLGDVVITNAARLQVKLPENAKIDYNNQTFTCADWFPAMDLVSAVQSKLLFPLNQVVTTASLETAREAAASDYQERTRQSFPCTVADLLNPALDPRNLGSPKARSKKGVPILTTDYYYIAPANSNYAALEMDDAVVAHTAVLKNTRYAFIRNISDTVVPAQTASGRPIPAEARDSWSSAIYEKFGLYTSFNSAVVAWATIASAES